jgi:hypothetical protein
LLLSKPSSMKLKLSTPLLMLLLLFGCTKTNNTISPTNTVTVTLYSGTSNAENITFNSVPSTSTLATGTPFIINGTGYIGGSMTTMEMSLNNPNCSYPNFVSGTYTLCGTNPDSIYTSNTNCPTGTNNSIHITIPSCCGNQGSFGSYNSGSVTVNFNNGIATGSFKYHTYLANGSPVTDSSTVTGSFSVSY